ncbi:carbonic anhydrase [Alphaproteobacteria bacterium]|nr:carbonic anhydrase [Alphaproteobacteria bacterium]
MEKLSPLPNFLVNRYNNWKANTYLKNKNWFKKIAKEQSPKAMVISCCDSRVHVTSIFGADEGDFFIHRNIANLVPPFTPDGDHHGTSAAIEYATKELRVPHLIVLGHTGCGGIKSGHALHSNNINPDYIFINKWLNILLPAYKNVSKNISQKNQIQSLEEESIKISLTNLFDFPDIKESLENKTLSIHGLIHDIGSGTLKYLSPKTKKFEII